MSCEEILSFLPLHIGGDLTLDESASVEAHLKGCNSCSAEMDAYQLSFDEMQIQALLEPARCGLWADLEPRLDAADAIASLRVSLWRRMSVWLPAVAAVMAVAMGLRLLLPDFGQTFAPIRLDETAIAANTADEIGATSATAAGSLVEVPDAELDQFLLENGAYLRGAQRSPLAEGDAVPVSVRRRRF